MAETHAVLLYVNRCRLDPGRDHAMQGESVASIVKCSSWPYARSCVGEFCWILMSTYRQEGVRVKSRRNLTENVVTSLSQGVQTTVDYALLIETTVYICTRL